MTPLVCCGLQRAAPIGRSPLTALPLDPLPPSAVVPMGLSLPCVLPLPIHPCIHPLPFPREVVPAEAPDCPCFTARRQVHTGEGNGPRRWPPVLAVGDPHGGGASPRFCTRLPPPSRRGPKAPWGGGGGGGGGALEGGFREGRWGGGGSGGSVGGGGSRWGNLGCWGGGPLPNGDFWALGCPLVGSIPGRGHTTTL